MALIYMNARYYLPETGQFISPDTIVSDPQNPLSYNRYSCVGMTRPYPPKRQHPSITDYSYPITLSILVAPDEGFCYTAT